MNWMQLFKWLQTHRWAPNVLGIMLGSYVLTGAGARMAARQVTIIPSVENVVRLKSKRPRTADKADQGIKLSSIANRNLLGAKRENLHPAPVVTEVVEDNLAVGSEFDEAALKPCTLSFALRATLVAEGTPEWSTAVLYEPSKRQTQVYTVHSQSNQIGADATLVEIRSREIIVRRRDHFERCRVEGEKLAKSGLRKPSPKPAVAASSSQDDGDQVQKTGNNEWRINRDYLENDVLDNLSKVATQARIVPSFKNGKPNGFKLFSIKPKSLYSKIGLKNGDVIQKVNGYAMDDPTKALGVYQKLKDATSVNLEITRRGKPMTFDYNIE
jgi:general secretion pathway protein C